MPLTVSAIVSAGVGAYNLWKSSQDQDKADELAKAPRPNYHNSAIDQYLGLAKNMASQTRYPGQDRAEQNVGTNLASGINAATQAGSSSAGILSTISGLQNNANQADAGIAEKGLEYQDQNKRNYQQALQTDAQYADKEFDFNKAQPYMAAQQAAAGYRNASRAEQGAGIGGIAGGVGSAAIGVAGPDASNGSWLRNLFGMGGNSNSANAGTYAGISSPTVNNSNDNYNNITAGSPNPGQSYLSGASVTTQTYPQSGEMYGNNIQNIIQNLRLKYPGKSDQELMNMFQTGI